MEGGQDRHCFGRDSCDELAGLAGEALDEEIDEIGDVFFVFAQRGDIDGHHVEAVIEIFAEGAFFQSGAKIAICGGDQADVHFQRARSAEAIEGTLLQDAQQLYLRAGRDVADFVEEQRAFVGQLKFSRLAGGGTGEGAFFVAE